MRVNITCITHIHTHTQVHFHQFALFNDQEGDVPQLRRIGAVQSDNELSRVRNSILAIASDKIMYGDEAAYEASEILRRFFPLLFYSPFHLVRFLLDSFRLTEEKKETESALRDVLRRELSSLRHESTWIVLWNNQVELWRLESSDKDLDRDGCDLAYIMSMILKLLGDTTAKSTIQMRTVRILIVILVTAHRYLLSTLQNEIVRMKKQNPILDPICSLLLTSCSDLVKLVTECLKSVENKVRYGCAIIISRRVLQPYLLGLVSSFSLWHSRCCGETTDGSEIDFSLTRLLSRDRHDVLCQLGSSLGDVLIALEKARVKTKQRQHEWLVDIEMCIGM